MTDATQVTETAEAKRLLTLDELMAMQGDDHVEIRNGEVFRMPGGTGRQHTYIMKNVFLALHAYAEKSGLGEANPDNLIFLMYSSESSIADSLIPDVSFVLTKNISQDWDVVKPYPGVPDLAVEIISPSETAHDIETKRLIYLKKGTQQVWLVYPKLHRVQQYINGEAITYREYAETDTIDASPLLPDFTLALADIFKLPPWAKS